MSPAAAYCGICGAPTGGADHVRCTGRARLEPPRFCGECARRMKVQVTPTGWSATCVEHGTVTA